MAETHELRLKINAAAARAGSREFVAAIAAIKKSILDLDRMSDGTFKRLAKNTKEASKAARVTVKPVDRSALRSLDSFAKLQAQTLRQTVSTRRGISLLMDNLRTVASAYGAARTANEAWTQSIARSNSVLTRQAQLAAQAAQAARTARPATPSSPSGGGRVNRAAEQQIGLQNRIKRAVDDTRLSVEKLKTQLMKVGEFDQIRRVGEAFSDFQRNVTKAGAGARDLDTAKTKLNSTMRQAQSTIVTINQRLQEEARITKAAAEAAKQKAQANAQASAASKAAAAADKARNASLLKQEKLTLTAAAATRRAAEEVARLKERMRRIGDVQGIAQLSTALNNFRTATAGGVSSAMQLQRATSQLAEATSRARLSITRTEAAQQRAVRSARELANAENATATNARRMANEMRAAGGSADRMGASLRNATGNMRGLENAFSGTFQIGSAFRVMLGSITFGTFAREVFQAGAALQQFRVTMEVATGSMRGASEQMDFIDGMARELGTNLRTTRDDFSKFAVSAQLAGVQTGTARDIFRSVSQAMAVMGRGAEDQRLAFLALEQMLSKNVVSSEELRRQLGERLPGAVNLMARAVGVSTGELQKMLKAGELVSSEVLPKFAKEVDKAFGPGLEKALQRAPAALGRFRNEVEFFLSAIADSGFMDALAQGFNDLTRALQQPQALESARKLGEGLGKLATVAVDLAEVFLTNLDKIGAAAKIIFAGILVRQALAVRTALVTMGAQAVTSMSTMIASFSAMTTATAANTTVTVANGRARTAAAASLLTMKTGQDALLASTLRANGAMAASSGIFATMGAGFRALASGAGVAAGALGLVGRALAFVTGPIGIAIATLALVAPMFIDMSSQADKMADEVDAALRRAGVSFEEFKATAQESSNLELNRITSDLDTLSASLEAFSKNNIGNLAGLRLAMKALGDDIQTVDRIGHEAQAAFVGMGRVLGVTEDQLKNLSSGSKKVVGDLIEMSITAAESGTGFTELRAKIQEAMRTTPGAADILKNLDSFVIKAAQAEAGVSALTGRLVELYGTTGERALKDFSELAVRALNTGKGVQGLRDEMKRLSDESPELASGLNTIFNEFETAFRSGLGAETFRARVIDVFDDTAQAITNTQKLAENARKDADLAARAFRDITTAAVTDISGEGLFNLGEVDSGMTAEIRSTLDLFKELSTEAGTVSETMANIPFDTSGAQAYSAALREQVEALIASGASYSEIAAKVGELDGQFKAFDGSNLTSAIQSIADNASRTINALEGYRDSLADSNVAGRELIDTLIEQVQAQADAEARAYAAEAANYAVAASAREAGSAGRDGAQGLQALAAAFANLGAAGMSAVSGIKDLTRQVNREIDKKQMNFIDRSVANAMDANANAINKQREKVTSAFNQAMEAAGSQGADAGRVLARQARQQFDQEMSNIDAAVAELEAAQRTLATTETNNEGRPSSKKKGGGGSAKDRAAALRAAQDHAKAMKALTIETDKYLIRLDEENKALAILASGMTTSTQAARMLAAAQMNGLNMTDEQTMAFLRQIEAAEQLNEALTRMANDPVNDWAKGVATWREAGQQIETGVFESLGDTISNWIQTSKFDFESLGASILGTIADIMADKAVKELVTAFGGNTSGTGEGGFGLGGLLSDIFGNGGSLGDPGDPFAAGAVNGGKTGPEIMNALTTGGAQAAEQMRTAMIQGGQQAANTIRTGQTTGAAQGATQIQTAHTVGATQVGGAVTASSAAGAAGMGTSITTASATGASAMGTAIVTGSQQGGGFFSQIFGGLFGGGGGGGGGFGGLFSFIPMLLGGLFSEGGMSTSPVASSAVPLSAFRHAPSYAMGTPNTSGIPAILHDNEAVVPLSGNRKIPVAFSDEFADGLKTGSNTVNQTFHINTPDADSFRKSQKQIAAEAAGAGQRALGANG